MIRNAKAAAAKGRCRCGVGYDLEALRHDWRAWFGRKLFTFSGVKPHVCHHCVEQHRLYEAEKQQARTSSEMAAARRDPESWCGEAPLPADIVDRMWRNHRSRKAHL